MSENTPDLEAGRLAGMMTPQGLQVASPEDSLARLGIITNGIAGVNVVFRVGIAGCLDTVIAEWLSLRNEDPIFTANPATLRLM